ncbi:hypothetical protein RRG08_065034 [Elysia crispata]|uniref:Uncharacterized protein n=1 Tax=Elysia crispata TaxID=231223 RepID=A0AAE1AY53_9GAST|nr:hypothetical protein RRG08_065034 [Elysia crispata]
MRYSILLIHPIRPGTHFTVEQNEEAFWWRNKSLALAWQSCLFFFMGSLDRPSQSNALPLSHLPTVRMRKVQILGGSLGDGDWYQSKQSYTLFGKVLPS